MYGAVRMSDSNYDRKQRRRRSSKIFGDIVGVGIVVGFFVLIYVPNIGDGLASLHSGWAAFTGLADEDDVKAYRAASIEQRVQYTGHLCLDGSCLSPVDWKCGFTTEWRGDEHPEYADFIEAVDDCFSKMLRVVDLDTKLLKVRRICGRHHMTFRPNSTGRSPEDCAEAGGEWGKKAILWDDEIAYLVLAGVD